MNDLNMVVLEGRLTRNVELKYTSSGQPVAAFGLAINRYYKRDGDAQFTEEVTFVDVEAWGQTAERVGQEQKGRGVRIRGRLKLDTWQDQQTGAQRSKLKVVADSVELKPLPQEQGQQGYQQGPAPQAGYQQTPRQAQQGYQQRPPAQQAPRQGYAPRQPQGGYKQGPAPQGDEFTDDIPF